MSTEISSLSPTIGIFDSGVGGLSVLREIRKLLPEASLIFLADQANVPYGKHSLEEVRQFSEAITRYLLGRGAQIIVVACNSASGAALQHLRQNFPRVPFVGMEPAIKPAAVLTRSGVVGVLATWVTFNGPLYASVVERFAHGVTLLQNTCPGLVEQIEAGELDSPTTHAILEAALSPMLARGADTIVLGCTHYPFVTPQIQKIAGPDASIIDPSPAVAQQTARLIQLNGITATSQNATEANRTVFLTTGDAEKLATLLPKLLGEAGTVEGVKV